MFILSEGWRVGVEIEGAMDHNPTAGRRRELYSLKGGAGE